MYKFLEAVEMEFELMLDRLWYIHWNYKQRKTKYQRRNFFSTKIV